MVPVEMEDGPLLLDVDSPKEEMPSLVMAEEKMVRFLLSVKFFLCPPMRT